MNAHPQIQTVLKDIDEVDAFLRMMAQEENKKSCIVSNQEMSADLRETLQTHQSTETNIKTNGVFVRDVCLPRKGSRK